MAITTLLLDLDDTLVHQAQSDAAALEAAARRAGSLFPEVCPDAATLAQRVLAHAHRLWDASAFANLFDGLGISATEGLWARFEGDAPVTAELRAWAPGYRRAAWLAALAESGVARPAPAAVEQLVETFAAERRARHVVFEDVEPVLDRLRRAYRLGLVTNGAACLQREKLAGSGLEPYFDAVVVSGEVGVGKPDPRIFDVALAQLGAQPDEAAMVGDNPARDVLGAHRAGLRAIWLNRDGAGAPDPGTRAHAEIGCLHELPEVIG